MRLSANIVRDSIKAIKCLHNFIINIVYNKYKELSEIDIIRINNENR